MPRPTATQGRTGRPPVTSRAEILVAARRLIDRDGWEKLTIRRLAAELGIGATTLYHHVRDKEDLLLLLLTDYAAQIPRPAPSADPRERVIAAAVAAHGALAAWPWIAEVLTADGFIGLVGEPALVVVETIMAGAIECGRTPEQAVDVFRHIWYYTVGEILIRAHRRADEGRPARDAFLTGVDPARMPNLAAIGNRWPALAARDTYAEGVRALVAGLLTRNA